MTTLEHSLAVPTAPIWRLSVAQYHEMIAAGILSETDPVELLEGWLVTKMPKNPKHSLATQLLGEMLARLLPAGWFVNIQEPITTADSEPEPDVAVVRGERRDYAERHPMPDEVALVVEVFDSTLSSDRTLKARRNARAGIPHYWLLNLNERQLEAHSDPAEGAYRQRAIYAADASAPVIIAGRTLGQVAVSAVL